MRRAPRVVSDDGTRRFFFFIFVFVVRHVRRRSRFGVGSRRVGRRSRRVGEFIGDSRVCRIQRKRREGLLGQTLEERLQVLVHPERPRRGLRERPRARLVRLVREHRLEVALALLRDRDGVRGDVRQSPLERGERLRALEQLRLLLRRRGGARGLLLRRGGHLRGRRGRPRPQRVEVHVTPPPAKWTETSRRKETYATQQRRGVEAGADGVPRMRT